MLHELTDGGHLEHGEAVPTQDFSADAGDILMFGLNWLFKWATYIVVPSMNFIREHLLVTLMGALLAFHVARVHKLFQAKRSKGHAREELLKCKDLIRELLLNRSCAPLMLRLAWSDCATFDNTVKLWPQCGGACGVIRFQSEYRHESNNGLYKAIRLLEPIQTAFPLVSWADLIQMAGALAVEVTGGPRIEGMLFGRCDASNFHEEKNPVSYPYHPMQPTKTPSNTSAGAGADAGANADTATGAPKNSAEIDAQVRAAVEMKPTRQLKGRHKSSDSARTDVRVHAVLSERIPRSLPPYPDGAPVPGVHIRNVFYRLGFSNQEIVALCGAHTIGRAFSNRSGVTEFSSGPQGATQYTRPTSCPFHARADEGPVKIGMAGGCSWTANWLEFDNSFFRTVSTGDNGRYSSVDEGDLLHTPPSHEQRNPVSQNWVAHGRDPELMWLPTDNALQTDPEFRKHFQRYAEDQSVFFRDYAAAHLKMSFLGARFDTLGPISLEND